MPASPRDARAAQEAEQKRLGLIVARVAERDDVGFEAHPRPLEELVARRARGVFERTAPGPGTRRDVVAVRVKRPAKASRQSSAKGLLVVGRRTQLMIEMDDAGDPQLAALRELAQEESERDRIGAARQRDEHAGIRTRQIVRAG